MSFHDNAKNCKYHLSVLLSLCDEKFNMSCHLLYMTYWLRSDRILFVCLHTRSHVKIIKHVFYNLWLYHKNLLKTCFCEVVRIQSSVNEHPWVPQNSPSRSTPLEPLRLTLCSRDKDGSFFRSGLSTLRLEFIKKTSTLISEYVYIISNI